MQTRKVVTRGGKRVRGTARFSKTPDGVQWESALERAAVLYMLFHPQVRTFGVYQQAHTIPQGDTAFITYPDYWVVPMNGRREIWEIKQDWKTRTRDVAERLSATSAYFASHGTRYIVITSATLLAEPLRTNTQELLFYRRHAESLRLASLPAFKALVGTDHRPGSLGALTHWLGSRHDALSVVANDFAAADLSKHLTSRTELQWLV